LYPSFSRQIFFTRRKITFLFFVIMAAFQMRATGTAAATLSPPERTRPEQKGVAQLFEERRNFSRTFKPFAAMDVSQQMHSEWYRNVAKCFRL
jgi:hypothetical protein